MISLNQRQEKIILYLESNRDWITGKELSKLLDVSDRTIRSDIESINRYVVGESLIDSNLRHGYRINTHVLATLNLDLGKTIPQTPKERCVYIIQELLFNCNELSLTFLQDQIFVSGYSIDNDLKKIKSMLKPYSTLKLSRRKNYISLEGSEKEKRQLYKDLLSEETKGNFLNLNRLAAMYKDFDLLLVKVLFEETCEENHYHIREMTLPMLMIHIGIAIERMIRHNYVQTMRKTSILEDSAEYRISKEFFEKVEKKIRIKVVEDEIVLFSLLLLGKKGTDYSEDIVLKQTEYSGSELIDGLLEDIKKILDIDFTEDQELKIGLQMHIQSLMERQQNNIFVDNIYLQEIKKSYPLVFEIGVRAGKYLEDKISLKIHENEIGFIALHLGAAYDRANLTKRYRVVMIYPQNQALSNLSVQKITQRFLERMEIVSTTNYFEEQVMIDLKPDLILTTLPLKHDLDILTVQISIFVNYEDESLIFQALNDLDKKRMAHSFETTIKELVKPEFFYTDLEANSPQEFIEVMCTNLEKANYVTPAFKESVLQRESLSATSFAFGFAIPHSISTISLRSSISVAILNKPILWGTYDVRMVILLSISQQDRSLLKLFFDWLSMVVSNSSRFATILECKSHEEFIEKVIK